MTFPTSRAAGAVSLSAPALRIVTVACAAALVGCTSVGSLIQGDKIDYRSAKTRTTGLEVPPDLTQLARDNRSAPVAGTVSASNYATPLPSTPIAVATAAERSAGPGLRIERAGNERWLVTNIPPAQLWPQLQAFWRDMGFSIAMDQANVGLMETDWAENRAKLPDDVIRRTLGKLIDSVYSTGERDKFRTRVEPTTAGSEVYISHRGMEEVYVGALRDATTWKTRASDPDLEAIFLQRLMVRLGAKEEVAKAAVAAPVQAPQRAQILGNQNGPTLKLDENFDRAWRRVGLALDRSGFTVEDRDRSKGLYFVRYVDPSQAGKAEPGFVERLFSRKKESPAAPVRYRVAVRAEGESTLVQVQNDRGAPENSANGQRIVRVLHEDLK